MTAHQAIVITISDSAHRGERTDQSGPLLAELLTQANFEVVRTDILPDDKAMIVNALEGLSATPGVQLIATTGGTGLGPRDVTPEATLAVIERQIPGMAEAMRMKSIVQTPFAMTSRQIVGVRRHTLIINFPGSPKAVRECFEIVQPVLHHTIQLIQGHTNHGGE